MPQIMILCPHTRRPIPTNRSIRAEAFADADLGVNVTGRCPHCGQYHPWTKAQARLANWRPRPQAADRR